MAYKEYSYKAVFYSLIGIILIIAFLSISQKSSSQIPKDKQYHLYAGMTIGAWGMMTTGNDDLRAFNGIAWATLVGIGKESYDRLSGGKFDMKDCGYTVIGGCISVGIITAIRGIFKKNKNRKYLINGV